ncbi:MAG: peptide chain release factor N(5)-glutamine methyltransferase [Candidatus Cloacimonetes bacterium]|nr:peptide chain release factor N(5)-glutamine methyltransferase [Candidatus Cloacimonadota bacterium]
MSVWTILEIIRWTTGFLQEKGIENPRLDTELLISHILNCPRLDLYLNYDKPLSPEERNKIKKAVVRRANHEPLQYIIGEIHFLNCKIKTDKRALIPRPETELLSDIIIKYDCNKHRILDIGTGSGAIAVTLAKNNPDSFVSAVDISLDALALARENAEINSVDNIEFIHSDIWENINKKFNLIVSNPPYISQNEYDNLQPEITQFEPITALVAPDDGLFFYNQIITKSANYLEDSGMLFLEIGYNQGDSIKRIFRESSLKLLSIDKDLSGRERFIMAVKK